MTEQSKTWIQHAGEFAKHWGVILTAIAALFGQGLITKKSVDTVGSDVTSLIGTNQVVVKSILMSSIADLEFEVQELLERDPAAKHTANYMRMRMRIESLQKDIDVIERARGKK